MRSFPPVFLPWAQSYPPGSCCSHARTRSALGACCFQPALLALVQLAISFYFLHYVHGRLLIGDDHPSFLYRLQLLMARFPAIPFYSPEWNAGVSRARLLATGALAYFCFPAGTEVLGRLLLLEHAGIYTFLFLISS